jgi:DMSO/TMAO reductase YedYZ molybdopterin-dependent catalytic subunit
MRPSKFGALASITTTTLFVGEKTMPSHVFVVDPKDPRYVGRRGFLGAVAAGALAPAIARAQTAAAPAPVPGTISNEEILKSKDRSLQVHSERPLTGSAPAEFMAFDVTPTDRMFVRNNLLTPQIDANKHVLKIHGLVNKTVEIGLDDLKKLPQVTTQAMVECAGAGRTAFDPVPRGTPWSRTGGMGCPRWTGVRLSDVLRLAGVQGSSKHVAFGGADFGAVATAPPVIRSIPIAKAMDEFTLIATGINGQPLPAVHGFPMRTMVPGWVGSASIKWLNSIQLLDAPFKGTYMDDSYRMPRKPVPPGSKMPEDAVSTEDWPVKSMIVSPAPNSKHKAGGTVAFYGYAWAGERSIRGVEVSFDGGKTWEEAQLRPEGDKYAWRGFVALARGVRPGTLSCMARATDSGGNTQPMTTAWNPLGYFWNGIHSVSVAVEA